MSSPRYLTVVDISSHSVIALSDLNIDTVNEETAAIADIAKPKSPHKSKEKSKKPEKESKLSSVNTVVESKVLIFHSIQYRFKKVMMHLKKILS
jgi:hypothetical protein